MMESILIMMMVTRNMMRTTKKNTTRTTTSNMMQSLTRMKKIIMLTGMTNGKGGVIMIGKNIGISWLTPFMNSLIGLLMNLVLTMKIGTVCLIITTMVIPDYKYFLIRYIIFYRNKSFSIRSKGLFPRRLL